MERLCEYCASFHSLRGDVYCSRYHERTTDMENNLFHINGSKVVGHNHKSRYTFRYSFSGYQYFDIEGERRTIAPHSLLFIHEGQEFSTETRGDQIELLTVAFNPEYFERITTLWSHSHEALLVNPAIAPPAYVHEPLSSDEVGLFSYFSALKQRLYVSARHLPLEAQLERLITAVLRLRDESRRNAFTSLDSIRVSTKVELLKRLETARDYLLSTIMEPFDLLSLSRAAGMSRYHLVHTFKKVYGTTPSRYHLFHKMKLAREMLLTGTYSVGELAMLLGYENHSAFSRAYRRMIGESPSLSRP